MIMHKKILLFSFGFIVFATINCMNRRQNRIAHPQQKIHRINKNLKRKTKLAPKRQKRPCNKNFHRFHICHKR